jgi:hypothetical protein
LLTFGVNYTLDTFKHGRELAEEQGRQQQAEAKAKREAALRFYNQYRAMGDIGLRATRFVDDGGYGSVDDVRLLYQHFRDLLSMIRLGVLDRRYVQTTYGGDLQSLSGRFQALASRVSPRWRRFQPYELDDYGRLAKALSAMMDQALQDEAAVPPRGARTGPVSERRKPASSNEAPDLAETMDNVIYTGNTGDDAADFNEIADNVIYTGNSASDEDAIGNNMF